MEAKRKKKLSITQKETLISFMSSNKAFAQYKLSGVDGKMKSQQLWKELTNILNKQGPHKTLHKWQRVWTDLKIKAKREVLAVPQPKNKTRPVLNNIEDKIFAVLVKDLTPETKHSQHLSDPLPEPPQPSIKEEVTSSWSQLESEESWHREDALTEPPEMFNVELKPEYSEPENECTWEDPADSWQQENAPSEINETVENPIEDVELQETSTNSVQQELSSINSKIDKFFEENRLTNVLLGRIAVALEHIARK